MSVLPSLQVIRRAAPSLGIPHAGGGTQNAPQAPKLRQDLHLGLCRALRHCNRQRAGSRRDALSGRNQRLQRSLAIGNSLMPCPKRLKRTGELQPITALNFPAKWPPRRATTGGDQAIRR